MADEEWIGPLNQVEIMLLHGEGNRHDKDIKTLKETIKNLETSLANKKRELAAFKALKEKILREVVRCRGKTVSDLPIREAERPPGTVFVVVGGKPED